MDRTRSNPWPAHRFSYLHRRDNHWAVRHEWHVVNRYRMTQYPRIGVAVIVRRHHTVLLGRRIGNTHGAGHWQFPGGHLDAFETIEQCAVREVLEETGLEVTIMERGPYTNDIFEAEQRHYVTLFVVTDAVEGEPVVCEPEKCAEWRWFSWNALPSPLFMPIEHLLAQGYRPPA